jgi:hypothetical protein
MTRSRLAIDPVYSEASAERRRRERLALLMVVGT